MRPRGGAGGRALEALEALGEGLARRIDLRPRGPQQGELDGHPRLVSLADRRQRRRQHVDRTAEGEVRQRLGLGAKALGIAGRDREGIRKLARGADDDQLAEVGEQVAGELAHVTPGAREALAGLQRGLAVAGGDRIGGAEDEVGVGDAENSEHVVGLDRLAAIGDELIERPERVAKAARGGARDRADRAVFDLDRLGGGDAADHLRDLLERRPLEVEALAAIDDRRHDLVRLGGCEDEDGVRGRLLERLEERVPGLAREHVGLVEDVDLPVPAGGGVADALAQLADVVDRAIGGSVHLDHVERAAGGDRYARFALATRRQRRSVDAVERAGEDLGERGLAGAARADEEVGMVDAIALDRVSQGAHHVLLADDLVEGLGAVAPVKGRLSGHSAESSALDPKGRCRHRLLHWSRERKMRATPRSRPPDRRAGAQGGRAAPAAWARSSRRAVVSPPTQRASDTSSRTRGRSS